MAPPAAPRPARVPALPRPARPEDADEIVRLRTLMFEAMGLEPRTGLWEGEARRQLGEGLGERLVAWVVDDPERPGRLVASGVAHVEWRLPGPRNPSGRSAYILSMSTDAAHRRQGHARRILEALLADLEARGVHRFELHASADGEPLYRAYGFAELGEAALGLRREPPPP